MAIAKFFNGLRQGRSSTSFMSQPPQASTSDLSFTGTESVTSDKVRRWSSGSSDSNGSWEINSPIYSGDYSSIAAQLHDQRRHFHGLGVLIMKDFAYAGEWEHSKPHGHGVYISRQDGHIYEGAFVSGYAHGFGRTALYAGDDNLYVYGVSKKGKYHASASKGSSVRSKVVAAMSAARRSAMLALCTATPAVAAQFQVLSGSVQMPGSATALLFSLITTSASSSASASTSAPRKASMPTIVELPSEAEVEPEAAYTCRTAAELAKSYYVAPGAITALVNMLQTC